LKANPKQQGKKKAKLALYKSFLGKAHIPAEYEVAFLCDILHIPFTELEKQPFDWVLTQAEYYQVKSEAEADKARSEAPKPQRN